MAHRRVSARFIGLFLGVLPTFPAIAADSEPSRHYFAAHLHYMEPDTSRDVDQGMGASVLYGYRLSGPWHLETRLTGLVLERAGGGTDFYQQHLGVDAVWRFDTGRDWEPFALLGLAAIRNDTDSAELDGVEAGMHAGVGIVTGRLSSMNFRLRGELRYVHDQFQDGVQDLHLTIGVEIPFGDSSPPPPLRIDAPLQPLRDSDDDGVADAEDRCPYSLPGIDYDTEGCMLPGQTVRLHGVDFDAGTTVLTAGSRQELSYVVLALRNQSDLAVEVAGHTDSSGDFARNRDLSRERADAVATFLVLQGVPTQRLTVRGYGEAQPLDTNSTAAGRARNRRIELRLIDPAADR